MGGKKTTHSHKNEDHVHYNHKPFVFPTRAINADSPVNLDIMTTFNKINKNDVRNSRKGWAIIFTSTEATNNAPSVEWRYETEVLRDLDYKELRDRVATPLT